MWLCSTRCTKPSLGVLEYKDIYLFLTVFCMFTIKASNFILALIPEINIDSQILLSIQPPLGHKMIAYVRSSGYPCKCLYTDYKMRLSVRTLVEFKISVGIKRVFQINK